MHPGRTAALVAVVVACLVAATGCGGDDDDGEAAATPPPPAATPTPVPPAFPPLLLAPEEVRRFLESGISDEQAVLVEDGELTFAEYRAAVMGMAECARTGGARMIDPAAPLTADRTLNLIDEPRLSARGQLRYTFGSTREAGEALAANVGACKARYSEWIEALWTAHTRPNEAELAAARVELLACVTDGSTGSATPAADPAAELQRLRDEAFAAEAAGGHALIDRYESCLGVIRARLDDPLFVG